MNKKIIIFILFLPLLFVCKQNSFNTYIEFKEEFILSSPTNSIDILQKYNITSPWNIKDPNYLYLFAKLIYDKIGCNKWSDYLLINAIKKNNLFKNEALQLYIEWVLVFW